MQTPAPDAGRLIGLLERLVAIDTQNPPGRETEAAALLAAELDAIGFATEIRPLAEGRANVVGRLDNGAGPCFAFNSHMDTVPAGGGWTSDPFRLTERDGKLFGRGACDAKGPSPRWSRRAACSPRSATRGAERCSLMFVADEEIDGGGSRALAKQEPAPDLIVIGEPTNNAVFAAHKGCLRPLIRAKGKAAHSGRPELGVNAILAASRLMSLFDARDRELRAQTHPLVGHASLSVTRIAGGIGDNVIPENCEMVLDRRLLPGETLDAAIDELHAMLTRAKRDHGVEAEIAAIRTKAGSAETARRRSAGARSGRDLPRAWRDLSAARRADGRLRPRSFSRRRRRGHRARPRLARRRSPARRICAERRSRPRRPHLSRYRRGDDAAVRLSAASSQDRIRRMASISTMMPLGSEPMPTAERAWRPASPSVSTKRSEQPLITLG